MDSYQNPSAVSASEAHPKKNRTDDIIHKVIQALNILEQGERTESHRVEQTPWPERL